MHLLSEVTEMKGIGAKKAEALKKIEINKMEDFLFYYPRTYQDRRNALKIANLYSGMTALVRAKVVLIIKDKSHYKKNQVLRLLIEDNTKSMEVVFFNAKYIQNLFEQEVEYDFYGKVIIEYGKMQMIHPEFINSEKAIKSGIVPIYPITASISQGEMQRWQQTANELIVEVEEFLPADLIERNRLCSLQYALRNIHFPEDGAKIKEAKYRLVFDELLILQTGLLSVKNRSHIGHCGILFSKDADIEAFIKKLKYKLTNAQKRVVGEIISDMESEKIMNRLIQGDVGSGKTVIAEIALYKAVKSGFQGVLMAPTELLTHQHFEGLTADFKPHDITVGFLSGSMNAKEKREVLMKLRTGEIQILVGTHALLQPGVEFNHLGLVITDEQHRFGVNQRALLTEKGQNPDVLVMTATPIPRTLAVIVYGDLDISIIDELPPGRQKIITRAVDEAGRDKTYHFIESEMKHGRQVYIVTPLIDDSEILKVRSAESVYEELSQRFREYSIALLHGEMKQKEKDEIMMQFYEGRIDLLVSTVVIEVGINVPNATIMVVENSERFGLAQLHQLRGRVGRGSDQSYCILVNNTDGETANERTEIMVSSSDGFYIAEKDLELRGPGQFFGTKQHGLPDLRIADLIKHIDVLNVVKDEAKRILDEDAFLSSKKYGNLKHKIKMAFGEHFDLKL